MCMRRMNCKILSTRIRDLFIHKFFSQSNSTFCIAGTGIIIVTIVIVYIVANISVRPAMVNINEYYIGTLFPSVALQ